MRNANEFEPIENPYAFCAQGAPVGDPTMFFGRADLIRRIAMTIQKPSEESKCFALIGQYRSGKSSILYHLGRIFEADAKLLVVELGNIHLAYDPDSRAPLQDQILFGILRGFERAIRQRSDAISNPLDISFPDAKEFFEHRHPVQLFANIFENFKRAIADQEAWHGVKIVLLIDNFQYLYDLIVNGKLPSTFMQTWKAFLDAGYFRAVVVGVDWMSKFVDLYRAEFSTTHVERVSYLNTDDARRLIDEPVRIGGAHGASRYRGRAIERILELTAGHPFYINIVCDHLIEYMNHRRTSLVTEADIENVKDELTRGLRRLDLYVFHGLTHSGDVSKTAISREDALEVLRAIAENSGALPCPRAAIVCKTTSPIDAVLEDLVKREVIEQHGQSYQIRVGLFKEWLVVN